MMMRGMRWVCVKDAMDAFGYAATTGGEFAADAAWQAGDELMTIADEPEEMFEKVKKERRIARLMLAELRKRKVSFKEDQWMLPEDQAALAQRLAKKRKKT